MNTEKTVSVPNLDALELELAKLIGIRPRLTGKILSRRTLKETYLYVESDELAGAAGVLRGSFSSLKIATFGSSYDPERGFWMTINWRFNMVNGGSNGIDLLTAWCSVDGEWTFRVGNN